MKIENFNGLNMSNRTGVYFIRNLLNDKMYIGSAAKSFEKRISNHISDLNRGVHRNRHLQSSFSKNGLATFEFGVVQDCDPSKCIAEEQKWIDFFRPEYNINPKAGSMLGFKKSIESINKQRSKILGRKLSQEHKDKISKAHKGRCHYVMTQEIRDKIANTLKGVMPCKKALDMASRATNGVPRSQETKAKIGFANLGKVRSEETKQRISVAKKGVLKTPEQKLKMSASTTKWWAERKAKS